ncbi:hypothetical protein [Bradyrhizobium sp. ARR65]|uniref:hypothetical protein n=1 Tax=Bradyrhizobium sp. ARR65 TaxID=1040989 RepID=UPI000465E854|nr:hypothetical protein [Bradyrhizobium sp. ARR65]
MSFLWKAFGKPQPSDDGRQPISRAELEATITEVIRKADRTCECFGGVIIQPKAAPFDTEWEITGIRFGRSDVDIARKALAIVEKHMQRQFRLSKTD